MIRLIGHMVVWLTAVSAFAANTRIPIVMYVGQERRHTASAPLLTVSHASGNPSAVSFRYDRYGHGLVLKARQLGDAKLLCEHADKRIGEVLLVTVVTRDVYDRYERVVGSMSGREGLERRDVVVAGDMVVVTGRVYAQRDLQACLEINDLRLRIVCGVRLSSAAAVVQSNSGATPRAGMEIEERIDSIQSSSTDGVEGRSDWIVTIRIVDLPVFRLASADRPGVVRAAAHLVAGLNTVGDKWRMNAKEGTRPYPVSFRVRRAGDRYEISSLWSYGQGSRGERLASVSAADLQAATEAAGVSPDRLLAWWVVLLEDGFRCYYNAERPAHSTQSTRSPLVALYEDALKLHGSSLDRQNAAVELARAYFANHLVSGTDPFAGLLTTVPPDFITSTP